MKYFMELSSAIGLKIGEDHQDVITFVEYSPEDGLFLEFKSMDGKQSFGRFWFKERSEAHMLQKMIKSCICYGISGNKWNE